MEADVIPRNVMVTFNLLRGFVGRLGFGSVEEAVESRLPLWGARLTGNDGWVWESVGILECGFSISAFEGWR